MRFTMKHVSKFLILFFFLFNISYSSPFCFAQNTKPLLTIDETIEIALNKNPELLASHEGYKSARWEAKRSYLQYLPKVQLNLDFTRMDFATVRRANVFVPVGRNLIRQFAPDQDPNDIRPSAYFNNYSTTFFVFNQSPNNF